MGIRSMRQVLPLLIGISLAAGIAMLARSFIVAGIPEMKTVLVANAPLQPGETFHGGLVRSVVAHDSPFLRGVLREEELSRFEGGTVLMFIPAGAFIPRTAIAPSGQLTATARLSAVMIEGEQLLTLIDTDRIHGPPFSMLRPGDCLDIVAFFEASLASSPSEAVVASERLALERMQDGLARPEITRTLGLSPSIPTRPMAKWLARGVVRSIIGLSAPGSGEGTTAVRTTTTLAGSPRLLLGVPEQALEGIVYALGAAKDVHLVIAPPCTRAEIPPSTGFAERDLEEWIRAGRLSAGPPVFFLPSDTSDLQSPSQR
ncbi:MAG: hypothetical protein RMK32_00710 [Anaerolineae bacterium]|nr:hypothetical protein [Thermoflexus sp.]MDW8064136.1 hypothetical protein [Anaerolineae bacterium]